MQDKLNYEKIDLKDRIPFLLAALIWGALYLGIHLSREFATQVELQGFLFLYLVSLLNLFFLEKTITRLVTYLKTKRPAGLFLLFMWANLKLIGLFVYGWFLFQNRKTPTLGTLMGCSTLVWVPLVGGLVWSLRQNARRSRI